MRERLAILAIFALVLGAILFGFGYLDSVATAQEFVRTCPTGTLFPAQACIDLSDRLARDGALMATGFVSLILGVVALGLSVTRRGQGIPDIPASLFGPRSK